MKIGNLPISIYVILEGYRFDDIKDFPGITEDNWDEFEEQAEKLITWQFMRAYNNLMPLTNQLTIKHISIGIDIFDNTGGSAGYYHNDSDIEKGIYGFYISGGLLAEYMFQFHKDGMIKYINDYSWEHELIHLLDHNQITSHRLHLASRDVREFFIHFLLTFRNEGIANLFQFAKKQGKIKNPEVAKQLLSDECMSMVSSPWEDETQYDQLKCRFLEFGLPYSVGPWMVIHV